jgi:hypothetical protein
MTRVSWLLSLLILGAAGSVGAIVQDASHPAPARSLLVERVVFGIQGPDGTLRETDTVPLVPGTVYGWHARVRADRPVSWREELTLPGVPRTWFHSMRFTLRDDGRTGVTEVRTWPAPDQPGAFGQPELPCEKPESPVPGWIGHGWSVIPGDPAGVGTLKVYVEDLLVHEQEVHFR